MHFIIAIILLLWCSLVKSSPNCTCVPYYQCSDDLKHLNINGANMLDLRLNKRIKCTEEFDVCCENKIVDNILSDEPEKLQGCGYQNSGLLPWSVSIYHQKSLRSISQYKCGGSLIHSRAVVTAAHCVNNKSLLWFAKIGNQQRYIKNVFIHPAYSDESMANDVAVLILVKPIIINENVNPICIPPRGIVFDQKNCVVGVWKNNIFSSTIPYIFMLKLPIVQREDCVKALRTTRLGSFFQLHQSFICAGGENSRDTCTGDGGNSLVCPISNQPGRYHQVGIVSWGIGCGEDDLPGVYVNLSYFRDWIDIIMVHNGLDIVSYRY